jgi:hypothetical protein
LTGATVVDGKCLLQIVINTSHVKLARMKYPPELKWRLWYDCSCTDDAACCPPTRGCKKSSRCLEKKSHFSEIKEIDLFGNAPDGD